MMEFAKRKIQAEERDWGKKRKEKASEKRNEKDEKLCLTSFICCSLYQSQLKLLFLVFSFLEPKRLADFCVI